MLLALFFVVEGKTTRLQTVLADDISMVVDGITTQGGYACWQVLNHKWLMELQQVSIYFKFSSEMFSRTSPKYVADGICLCFLFRDGLLTLIYRASLKVLLRFWSSLPNIEKLSMVTVWPEMLEWLCIGEGAFRCSLNLSAKFLADSPMYSSSQSILSHLYLYMTPIFLRSGPLSFAAMRRFLMVGPPLRCDEEYIGESARNSQFCFTSNNVC